MNVDRGHVTHFACQGRIKELGADTPCCFCTSHKCYEYARGLVEKVEREKPRLSREAGCDHRFVTPMLGGFPGHEHTHPCGPAICEKCRKKREPSASGGRAAGLRMTIEQSLREKLEENFPKQNESDPPVPSPNNRSAALVLYTFALFAVKDARREGRIEGLKWARELMESLKDEEQCAAPMRFLDQMNRKIREEEEL